MCSIVRQGPQISQFRLTNVLDGRHAEPSVESQVKTAEVKSVDRILSAFLYYMTYSSVLKITSQLMPGWLIGSRLN